MSKTAVRNISRLVLAGVASALFGGCALLPRSEFHAPAVQMPAKWQEQGVSGTGLAVQWGWWKDFGDPVLNDLVDRALRSNNDLAAATIMVRRAQLKSGLTDTNITPSVEVSAASQSDYDLRHGTNVQTRQASVALSYELDLWGKLKSARDADSWEAKATAVDRENTALSLIGTTASAYWQIAYLHEELTAGEASIAYAERTLALVRAKYQAGAVSSIDVVEAERTVASQRANQTKLQQQLTEARNALAILFDQAPEQAMTEPQRLPDAPLPEVKAGLPASLLGQRPDLRAAELRLRENLANVDATRASFYPSITLTGSLGSSSTSLTGILQNPVGSLGAGLALPFVQWNTARLTVKLAETQYQESVVNFRQTLYQALGEVENALSARVQYENERVELERTLQLARKAEQLAGLRYRMGATAVQAWLDEQERRRNAETALAQNRLNRLVNLVKLYQALGGGMGNPKG
jgi:NodT family efflux transporter outer membrane factor (OMF) lipoprotein